MLIDKYINLGLEIVSRSPCRCVVYSHGCSGCHRIWGGQTKILIHVRHFTSVLNSKKYSFFSLFRDTVSIMSILCRTSTFGECVVLGISSFHAQKNWMVA